VRNGVYFIQAGGGEIKIGHSRNIEGRMGGLQTAVPAKLRLLAILDHQGEQMESLLHREFADYRLHSEWFMPGRKLLNYIRLINTADESDGEIHKLNAERILAEKYLR